MARKYRAPEFATGSDPRRVRAVQALRRSGAAGPHDTAPARQRQRGQGRRAAIAANRRGE